MALLYEATLRPTKEEILVAWVANQPWRGDADTSTIQLVGSYRFDDPDGDVGIDTHLLRTADGSTLHVPLTYRATPMHGAEASLITTAEHSVLGTRWVYDACGDPVYARALATAILTGGRQADLEVVTLAGERIPRESTATVVGGGSPGTAVPAIDSVTYVSDGTTTVMTARDLQLRLFRLPDSDVADVARPAAGTLTGTWPGRDGHAVLAAAMSR